MGMNKSNSQSAVSTLQVRVKRPQREQVLWRDASLEQMISEDSAAAQRQQNVEETLQNLEQLQRQREKRQKGSGETAQCSTTDPEARKMKMVDGGFRPASSVRLRH